MVLDHQSSVVTTMGRVRRATLPEQLSFSWFSCPLLKETRGRNVWSVFAAGSV